MGDPNKIIWLCSVNEERQSSPVQAAPKQANVLESSLGLCQLVEKYRLGGFTVLSN